MDALEAAALEIYRGLDDFIGQPEKTILAVLVNRIG
jgi:hypothetical protein